MERECHGIGLHLEKLTACQCRVMLGFAKENRIYWPEEAILKIQFRSGEGLCILLGTIAYPNRLVDLQKVFGGEISNLSVIINHMLDFTY